MIKDCRGLFYRIPKNITHTSLDTFELHYAPGKFIVRLQIPFELKGDMKLFQDSLTNSTYLIGNHAPYIVSTHTAVEASEEAGVVMESRLR
jgi:hypothetical protein